MKLFTSDINAATQMFKISQWSDSGYMRLKSNKIAFLNTTLP